jgi:replicative DNA helicase
MKKNYSKYQAYKPAELLLNELQNEKKELAVLGAIFLLQDENPMLHYLAIGLAPDHFYNLKFQEVYEMAVDKAMLDRIPAYQDIPDEILQAYDFDSVDYTNYKEDVQDIIALAKQRQDIAAYAAGYSILQGGGTINEALTCIESKTSIIDNKVETLQDISFDQIYNNKVADKGVITGFNSFDNAGVKFLNGQLIAIGADTGAGKTTFLLNIIAHQLKMGNKVLMFSLEQPAKEILDKLLTILSGYAEKAIREGIPPEETIRKWYDVIQKNVFVIFKDGLNISEIKTIAKQYHQVHKLSLIAVDYWQLAQGTGDNALERYVSTADGLLALALSLNIPVISLAQVDKASSRLTNLDRNAFSGSKQLSNNASYIIMLQRDKDTNQTVAEIVKSRKPNHYGRKVNLKINKLTEKLTEDNYEI